MSSSLKPALINEQDGTGLEMREVMILASKWIAFPHLIISGNVTGENRAKLFH